MSDSPDFYSSEILGDRFTDFCVHTARLSGNRLKQVGRLEKIGQWDHGIKPRPSLHISQIFKKKGTLSLFHSFWLFHTFKYFSLLLRTNNFASNFKVAEDTLTEMFKFKVLIHTLYNS